MRLRHGSGDAGRLQDLPVPDGAHSVAAATALSMHQQVCHGERMQGGGQREEEKKRERIKENVKQSMKNKGKRKTKQENATNSLNALLKNVTREDNDK